MPTKSNAAKVKIAPGAGVQLKHALRAIDRCLAAVQPEYRRSILERKITLAVKLGNLY